ncbi:MAG TPA: hypothetical protein VKA77_04775, partial [Mycobacterium sp.]|nr:hypothetical protein [Mycobacterium sp.]
ELHSKISGTTRRTWAVRRYTAGAGGQVIVERSTTSGSATGDCTNSTPGGAAPCSTSYTYNPAGLRQSETQHAAGSDTTLLSCYGNPDKPHTLTATTGGASCTA